MRQAIPGFLFSVFLSRRVEYNREGAVFQGRRGDLFGERQIDDPNREKKMKPISLWAPALMGALLFLTTCGEDLTTWEVDEDKYGEGSGDCPEGEEGCPCSDDDECDGDLTCEDGVCEEDDESSPDDEDDDNESSDPTPECNFSCVSAEECMNQGGAQVLSSSCPSDAAVCCDLGVGNVDPNESNCDFSCLTFQQCLIADGTPDLSGSCTNSADVCCEVGAATGSSDDNGDDGDGDIEEEPASSEETCPHTCITLQSCFNQEGVADFGIECPGVNEVCCDLSGSDDSEVAQNPDCAYTCTTTQQCNAGNGTLDFGGTCEDEFDVCCDFGSGQDNGTCPYVCLSFQDCFNQFGYPDFSGTCTTSGLICCNI
jgi:hypothetical protein